MGTARSSDVTFVLAQCVISLQLSGIVGVSKGQNKTGVRNEMGGGVGVIAIPRAEKP